ncbi:uroporphyrinogen decarboxylase family protein [Clostridium botulinum]|uniref:Methylcobamide--CoM methyltransferase n=1 Tax=Clostridium botulinum TaxID=1491 RepID=A0A6G4EGX9_CLOBO|nr:uroporphyrinogen decarboxylase family protein [Clostridium botulinum]APH20118.1 uroporphyrinogen decarboxylase family protein [Clostridium botulinum]AUM91173.1 methylcobamide--CoM methyltransferase [Clostridium botulinum]NFB13740.1 methylcobamide--CoM methyltransferase [Clostridium botulinum]NFH58549.1 methylcobamide--CoM methyltransferase [Clostridium botulinum]NFH62486.1 methylcobamide--CoM methyltransferase [Clostridium botulinum]
MDYDVNFKCVLDTGEEMPKEAVERAGIKFPDVHKNAKDMAVLSKGIKEYNEDFFSIVPFCMTVEAEALGGEINLGDEKAGPRVSNYTFKSIEDIEGLKEIDFKTKRIGEVLKSVEILKKEGETVIMDVQGPFTIISSLIDPRIFYKAVRKNKDEVERLMKIVQKGSVEFIKEGVKRGVDIISFGDSAGTLDILGPKMYKELGGKYTYNVLKEAKNYLGDSIIHLCGITSSSLDRAGFIKSNPIEVPEGITYGQALNYIIKENKDVKILGHNCLRKTIKPLKKPIVWEIKL